MWPVFSMIGLSIWIFKKKTYEKNAKKEKNNFYEKSVKLLFVLISFPHTSELNQKL